jgi:predicted ATPase
MPQSSNWYVITGGPSSGKTTLIDALSKLGYKTHPEAARQVIDRARASGQTVEQLRADERAFQEQVFETMLQRERQLSRQDILIFDRGLGDSLAYLNSYGWQPSKTMAQTWPQVSYQTVFLLEPLDAYTDDYARTEGADFASRIHSLLDEAYRQLGHTPILVPKLSPDQRLQFILEIINRNQDLGGRE